MSQNEQTTLTSILRALIFLRKNTVHYIDVYRLSITS